MSFPSARHLLLRRRRAIAALLAGLAVAAALLALSPSSAPATSPPPQPWLRTGEVATAVAITAGEVLREGDIIDLVHVSPSGDTSVIARNVRVLEQQDSLRASGGEVNVLVAMSRDEATQLSAASLHGQLSAWIVTR